MEQNVKIFANVNIGSIRIIVKEDMPLFLAKDISDILGYTDTNSMTRWLDDDEKYTFRNGEFDPEELGVSSKIRMLTFINESGLYNAIFNSRKEEAKKFKKWITSEVLPSLRKNGEYSLNRPSYQIRNPIERAKKWIEEEEIRIELERQKEEMKPKALYFDKIVNQNLLTNLRDTAKEFNMRQKDFIEWLTVKGYIYRTKHNKIRPYLVYVREGYFEMKELTKHPRAFIQTLITPKGRKHFLNEIKSQEINLINKTEK